MADQNTTITAAELEKDPFIKSIFKSSSIAPQEEDNTDAFFITNNDSVKTELDTLRKQEMEDPLPLHRLIGEQKEFEKLYKINNPNYTSADLKKLYADFKTQKDSVRAEITNRRNRIKELTQEYNQKRADHGVFGGNYVWDKDKKKQIISKWKETGDPTWFKLQKAKKVPGVDLARIEKAEQNYIGAALREQEDLLFESAKYDAIKSDFLNSGVIKDENSLALDWKIDLRTMKLTNGNQTVDIGKNTLNFLKKLQIAKDLNGRAGMNERDWRKFFILNPEATAQNPEFFIDPDTKTETRDQDLQKIVDNYFSENLLLETESAGRRFIRIAHEKLAVAKADALEKVKKGEAVVLQDGRIAKADAPAGEGIIFDPNDYNGYLAFIPDGTNVDELVYGDPEKFAETYAAIGLMLANPNEQTFLDKKYDTLKKYWAKNGAVNAFNIARNVNYRNSNDFKRYREFEQEETDAFLNIMKNPQAVDKVTDGIGALAAVSIMKDGWIEGKTNAEVGKRLGFFASFADGFGESFGSLSHFANNVLKGSAITATANAVLDDRFMRINSLKGDLVSRIKTFGPEIVGLNQLSKKYKVERKKANDKFKLYAKQLGINVTDEDLKTIEITRHIHGNEIGTAYNDFVKENPYVDQLIDPWMRIAQKAEVAGHPIIDKDSRGNITRQGYADLEKMKKAVEMTADLLDQNAIYKSHLKTNDFGRFLGSATAEVAYMAPEAIGPGLGKLAFSGVAKGVAKSAARNAGKTAVQKFDDALLAAVTPNRGQLYILGNVPGRTATRAGLERNWQKLNQSADGVSVNLEELNDKESVLLSDVLPETLAEYAVGPVAGALGKLIKSGGGKLIAKVTKNNAAGKFINRLANNSLVSGARKGVATVKEFVPTQSGALGEWMEERASAIYEATFNFNNSSAGLGERMRDALSFSKNWEQWGAEIAAFSIPGLAGAGGSVLIDAGKRGIGKITNNKSDRQKLIERVKTIDAFVKENSPLDYNNGNFDWAAATAAKALADFRENHPDVNVLEVDKVTGKAINELPNHVNLTEQEVMQAALYEHYTDIYPELKNSVEKSVQNGTPAESAMTDAIRRGMIRDSIAVRTSEDFTEQQKAIVTDAVNQEYLAETIGALQSDKDLAGNSYAQEKILEAVQMMPDKESVRLLSPEAVQAQYTAIYNRLQKEFAPQMASNSVTLRNLYVNETGRTAPTSAPAQETAPVTPEPTAETTVSTPAQAQPIAETNAVTPEPATAIPATKQLNDNILPGTSKIENIDSILAESTAENKSNAEIAEQIINAENAPAAETVTKTEQTVTEQQTTKIPQGTAVSTTEQAQDTVKPFEPLASRDNASKAELSRIARMGLSGSYEIGINNITGEKAETANAIKTLMESALGVEVVFYHNPDNRFKESGFHTGGRIFINERILEKSEVAIRTVGHEFLHFLADSNPELYKQLQAVLLEKAKTNKLLKNIYDKILSVYSDKRIQELNNNYSGSVNMDLINEEFTNRVFEAFFTDQNFAKEVLSNIENENPGIIKQLWEAFKKYVNAFIRAAQSNENLRETYKEHLKEDFSKFENLLKSVIKEYQAKNRERIAQWNKQEQIQQEVVGTTAANGVQAVKVSEINVDPERFQFKQDMKKDTGVSTSSQITAKKWNPLYAGLLYLWQDKDGKLFVVNGHHRLDLAKRLGVSEINAQIDREVDGVTAEQAYIKGALINIKNGNGTVYDYANFFRKSKMSRQDALDDGFIAKGKTLAGIRANEQLKRSMIGWLIAQGSEDLWSWYVNQDENAENKITDEMFATIVEKADGVDSIELYAINAINRGAVKNMAELNSVLDGAKSRYDAANQDSGMSDGFLFGDSEADAMIEADKKLGDFARKKSNELQGLISILKKVLNNPKNAKATKIKIDKGDIRSVEQVKKDLQEYEKQKVMFDNPFVNRDFVEMEMRKAETGEETAAVAPATKTEKKKLIKEKAARKTDVNESTPAETDSKPKPKTETKATLPKFKLEHIEHIDKKDVPKDVVWKDRKFKSKNYYSSVRVGIMGNDAYFEFSTGLSPLQQKVFYKISDFRDTSIMQVRREIEDYFSGNSEAYPMGKNFDDALDSLHDDGMRVENYSTLKPMTASTPAAKTPKAETQSASAPAMSDEFPLLTKEEDANDFQLKGETVSEKDQQKIEDQKAEEGKKKAEKETLDLPIEENKTPAENSNYSLRKELERYKSDPVEYLDALETLIVSANKSKTLDEALDIAQEYTEYSNATRVLRAVAEHPQSTKAQKKKAEDIIKKADNERSDRALENWRKNNLMTDDFADDLKGRSKHLKPKAEKDAIERVKEIAKNINKNADAPNPDIRFSLLDADAMKDLSPLERLIEAFEESEPNEIDRNIYIVFRKYMDELIEQGSVKQDSDFARANAVLQNYERDHGIHQASLLYRKMIADKMFVLPVFKEFIGTADEALKTALEVPKDFANAVKTVFTGAKFKSVFTEEERKTVDHGEAIEAAQKPEDTDKEQSNDENSLHLTDEQMEKDGYTAEQKKEQKEFAERIEELGKKLDNKEISAKQAKDELADIYDKYTTPFDNFILRYSASANKNKKLGRNDVIGTAWLEFQNRIEDYAKSPTGDFTRSLVNATNTSITREKNKINKQWENELGITDEEGKNYVEEIADPFSDTRGETDDAMQSVKEQLLNIAKELRSRLENTKDKEDRLVLLRRSWVSIAIADIGGMAYERRNVVDWLNKHIAEIEKDCENHGVVWDRTYGKGTDERYNKDKNAIFPNIHMSILSEEMNENMKKAGVLQMISSALSAAEMPTNYQKDISWLERVLIPSAQYFNKTPQIFKFYTALDDINRYKMDMLANLTGDNGLGDNYIVTMQRLEDKKPEKAKSLYRYIIDADRFRICGKVDVVSDGKRRYWYTYHDGSSSRDFNTAAERDKAMELDPQYKKQKLIARSEPKDIRFVATDKDGKTIGSYKSFTEAHIAVIQNEIKTLAVKGITIDGINHKFDNEQLLALQSFRLMALNGYNQIAKRFAEIRNHIESSGGDFASFLKEQKVFDIYDEFVKMGKVASYYMPRIRKPGRYKITAKRGEETILYFVDSVSKIRLKAEIRKLKKDGWTDVEYEDTGDHTNAEIVGLDLTRLNTIVNQALQQMEKDAFKNGVLDNKMLKDSFGMELTIDSGVTDKKGNKHDNIEIVFDKSHYQAELNLALREFLKDSVAVVKENDSTITAKWIVPANQGEMLAKTFIKSIMNIHGKQTVLGSFTETLQNVIGSIIKASGYRARTIARNEKIGKEVTQGYVENPLEAMKMYLSAMAEGQSRTRFAHASAAIAGGWDYSYDDFMNEKHPGEEKSAMYYIEYCIERDKRAVKPHTQMHKDIMNTTEFVLTNADLADRMIASVNGIASIYFLSSPSSALVNTLALYTHVPAAIAKSLDESALQAVANVTGGAKRYIQYALARRNGKEAKGLTDEEKAVFGLMGRLGYDSNSNMANALATLDQNTAFGKAQKIMMAFFSITESMSRASAIYAAYKAIVEKMKKQGKKFDWKNEDQLRAVLAAAKKVSDQALVDFSKGGKVGIMKNKTAKKVLAPFMLFQSFGLNTINLLLKHDANIAPMLEEFGLETKTDKASLIKRLVKGSAWMILTSTLLAGLDTMLPISVLQGWFGGDDDDPEKWRKEIAKQLATVFGLIPEDSTYSKVADRMLNCGATSFMNLDLRGSLSTWTILQKTKFTAEEFAKRLFGAPGSLAASFSRSADEFSNAYRDGIWNPESIIKGTEYALPKLLASPLKAYRESVYGVTTLSGKSVLDPDAPDTALTEEEQKLYLTGDEREWWKSYNFYRRALGFNPADISKKRAEIYANKLVKQGYANRKKELGERIENYVQAVKDGKRSFNSAEWKQIEQDAEEMRKEYFDLPEEQRKDIPQVTNKWFNEKIESVTKLSTKQKASAGDNKAKRRLLNMRQRKENESQEPIKRSK